MPFGGSFIQSSGLALLLLAGAWPGSTRVANAANVDSATASTSNHESVAAESDLLDAYRDLCLNRFPDETAFGQGVAARRLEPMPPDAVKQFLHDDPGRGWAGKSPSGVYVVTVENPPFVSCAVRRMQKPTMQKPTMQKPTMQKPTMQKPTMQKPRGPSSAFDAMFRLTLGSWRATREVPPMQALPLVRRVENGATISILAQAIVGSNGKPSQLFMAIVTDYPGGRSEVRYVRQFPPE